MTTAVVLIDSIDGTPTAGTAQAIAAASAIGEPFGIASSDLDLQHLTRLGQQGLSRLAVVPKSAAASGRSLNSDIIASALIRVFDRQSCKTVVAEPTTLLREVLGRVAGRRGNAVISGVSGIDTAEPVAVTCAIDGGLREASVSIHSPEPILLLHPTATFSAPEARTCEVEWLNPQISIRPVESSKSDRHVSENGHSLRAARIVISGGRGLGSADGYSRLRQLAEVLDGAIGASRAAVEAGWAPHDALVGQTGATIAPDVYMAFGISGAPQHLAGIRGARVIIAINTDPRAPILAQADLAVVGDARAVLDGLIERITSLR